MIGSAGSIAAAPGPEPGLCLSGVGQRRRKRLTNRRGRGLEWNAFHEVGGLNALDVRKISR